MSVLEVLGYPSSGRRARIRAVAARLMRSNGYAAVTMKNVAEAAGVGPVRLLAHFASKEDLLAAICFTTLDRYCTSAEHRIPGMYDCLEPMIADHVRVAMDHPDEAFVTQREWRNMRSGELERFRAAYDRYAWTFSEAIRTGIRTGRLREFNPQFGVRMLFSLSSSLNEWLEIHEGDGPRDVARQAVELLLGGLRAA